MSDLEARVLNLTGHHNRLKMIAYGYLYSTDTRMRLDAVNALSNITSKLERAKEDLKLFQPAQASVSENASLARSIADELRGLK